MLCLARMPFSGSSALEKACFPHVRHACGRSEPCCVRATAVRQPRHLCTKADLAGNSGSRAWRLDCGSHAAAAGIPYIS